MHRKKETALHFLGALLGVFQVDWDSDFPGDGYTDVLGLAPLDEPLLCGGDPRPKRDSRLIHIPAGNHRAQ